MTAALKGNRIWGLPQLREGKIEVPMVKSAAESNFAPGSFRCPAATARIYSGIKQTPDTFECPAFVLRDHFETAPTHFDVFLSQSGRVRLLTPDTRPIAAYSETIELPP